MKELYEENRRVINRERGKEIERERERDRFLDFTVLAFLASVYLVCKRTYSRKSQYFLAQPTII